MAPWHDIADRAVRRKLRSCLCGPAEPVRPATQRDRRAPNLGDHWASRLSHAWSNAVRLRALGVGLATIAMALTGTIHPPAGANPVVVILSAASWPFLLVPVLSGAVAIVLIGAFFNRVASRKA